MTRLAASKALALGLVTALGASALFAWSRTWFTLHLDRDASLTESLAVGGDAAAPALVPLALASLALVAALAIAAPVVRVVLSAILAVLGAAVAWVGFSALTDPLAASATSVVAATGLDGRTAVLGAVSSLDVGPWPVVTIVVGGALAVVGVLLAFSARRWRKASDRYQAPAPAAADSDTPSSTVSDWDSLSGGDDPTSLSGSR